MFVLTTLALDRYAGLSAAWEQTKGIVLRILGVVGLSGIPIGLAHRIVVRIGQSAATGTAALLVLGLLDVGITFLSSAVTIGAIALCYRFATTDSSGRTQGPSHRAALNAT